VLLVGLTGGIGSGKSTVAGMLERRGAVVIDADELARLAVAPGGAGYDEVVRAFGPSSVGPEGTLDRRWLADVVFADPEARMRLEAIVHPEVARLFAEAVAPYRDTDRVVVYVVPLLAERGLADAFDLVMVVWAPEHLRIERLMARGLAEPEARARVAAQASDDERRRVADIVLTNDGSLPDLETVVDRAWRDVRTRGRSPA
jgi:dephospho-CoA kinase